METKSQTNSVAPRLDDQGGELTLGQKLTKLCSTYLRVQGDPIPSCNHRWESVHNSTLNKGQHAINSISWNKTGSHLIAGGRDTIIRVFAMDKQMQKSDEFKGHTGNINMVAFNPGNESSFASVSNDKTFRVWDIRQSKAVHVERTKLEIVNGVYSPSDLGLYATCNYQEEMNFYDTRMWKIHKQLKFKNEVNAFSWDHTGSLFFVADSAGKVALYNGKTLSASPETVLSGTHVGRTECIKVHPSNKYMVTGGQDSIISFWDLEDLLCSGTLSENDFQVRRMDFSPDGKHLAAICFDEIDKKWSLELYDAKVRAPTAVPYTSSFQKTALQWHPSTQLENPLLALSGECDKDQGVVHIIQLKQNFS